MRLDIRELLIKNGFQELYYNSGIYIFNEFQIHFLQNDWSVENWLTIERIQNKNKFIKFNSQINSIEDLKYLIELIMKKKFDAH
jgi:predicted SAM-dependent methyltransferase